MSSSKRQWCQTLPNKSPPQLYNTSQVPLVLQIPECSAVITDVIIACQAGQNVN